MNQSINTTVSDRIYRSPGYILGAQLKQVAWLVNGSATIKLQEDLILDDHDGLQNQILKSCLQKSEMFVYSIS